MKKIFYVILTAAAIFTGCSREADVENPANYNKRHVTIQANINQTKSTVTDEGVYSWSANETIGVVEQDGSAVIPFSIADAEEGLFSGTLTVDKDPVFAVSPAGFVSGVSESGGDIEYDITLDNIDNYVPGTTNAIMVAEYSGKDGDNYKFHFNHIAALIKVPVVNIPVGTAKVKLTLDKNITGIWADLNSTTPTLNEDTDLGEPSLTLTLKKSVTNPNTSANYYFPVPCNTYTSFQFEMLNADGDRIKGMKKTGLNILLSAADLFITPTINIAPVAITKGAEWTYTFGEKKYTANETQTLTDSKSVSMDWTLDGEYSGSGYWGYDSINGKGHQFGSGSAAYSSLTLTADSGVNGIEDVVINTSGASSIKATVSVSVGGTPFVIKGSDPVEDSADLTATATEYTFTSPDGELYVGDIVISYENSSSKAIYIKTISLNPDTRIDPEFAYATTAYSVVASSTLATPALSSVDGFNGTVTYAIGAGDDPDVASVNAETGAVTIGAKAGSVTVTASFAGNASYKPDSASYTITVGAAALSVSTNNPAAAECTAGATSTFTVTSNVEWSATTTDDGTIITNISPSGAQSPSANPVTVTVTFAANAGAQRTATVNVKPSNQTAYSALNQSVTMTQKLHTADVVFEKYSGVLTSGTYLLVDGSANVAVKSIISSNRAGYRTVSEYETGKIKNPIASIVWEIDASGDYWTAYSDTTSTYLGGTSTKNQAALLANVTDYAKWSVASTAQSTTYDFVNKGRAEGSKDTGNKYLRYNSGYGFACYTSGTGTELTLYKLVDNTVWDLKSIAVKTAPTKVTYEAGEHFDPTGLVITATYSDHAGVKADKTVDVTYNNTTAEQFTFSPTTSAALTTGNTSVSITWNEVSTSQDITVNAVYAVTFAAPSHGSLSVFRGESALTSGNSVPAESTINVTATPDSGYELSTLVYNDGSDHDIKAAKTFTMPAHAVSITATFAEIVSPTISMNTTSITNVAAAGVDNATASNAYNLLNGASNDDVDITYDGTVVKSASKNATEGTITYTVDKNTGAARNGWIKVKYGSEDPHQITVSQLAGAPAAGTVLWTDTFGDWGSSSTTFTNLPELSNYTYTGRSAYSGNTDVTLTASSNQVRGATSSGGNCTSGHLWFNKSQNATVTTSAIRLYGATSLVLSYDQGTKNSSLTAGYSTDGGTNWTDFDASGPAASSTNSFAFTVQSGTTSIILRFVHSSSNGSNTRFDNPKLAVGN